MEEPDVVIKEAISDYLITGNMRAFVRKVTRRYEELEQLKRFFGGEGNVE